MRLVVTTWNLQGSKGVDVEAVAAHVRDQGTDLLLLQEVQRRQARLLAGVLQARSQSWAFKHWPVRIPAEGMAVLGLTVPARARARGLTRRFRWWSWRRRIVQVARIRLAHGRATPGERGRDAQLTVANVHLTPHGARTTRAGELATVARLVGDGGPLMVAGDVNDLPGSPVAVELAGAGLRDAWATAHPDPGGAGGAAAAAGGATNWSGVRRDGPPSQRIDHVWVSPDVEVVAAHVPAYGEAGFARFPPLSDHLPLTVTLDI